MAVEKPPFEAYCGFFILVGVLFLVFGWTWLHSFSLFHPPQKFIVKFHDVAGLNNNAPVNVNGVRVGTVENLTLVKKGEVHVALKIDTEKTQIPEGSVFTIQTLGLVGAKYVEINFPEPKNDQEPPAIASGAIENGQDPVRVELVANRIATNLSHIDFAGVEGSMSKNLERVAAAADSVQDAAERFGGVAADAKGAAQNANKFFARGTKSFDNVDALANNAKTTASHITAFTDDWRQTSHKVNKILDNPQLSGDLKETVQEVRQTAETVKATIDKVSSTLQNDKMRGDLITALSNLNKSTDNVYKSLGIVNKMAGDTALRADLKHIVDNANTAMDKVNGVVSEPTFGPDLKHAVDNVNIAAKDMDMVAKQMNHVLNEKRPLWKLMFGRPGYVKTPPEKAEMNVRGSGVDTASKAGATTTTTTTSTSPQTQPAVVAPATAGDKHWSELKNDRNN
ncbi:MAG TPA: MlaD family protein [Planktothrix sp.]|jgi:ABC-type transporter Mla subunit MlaD